MASSRHGLNTAQLCAHMVNTAEFHPMSQRHKCHWSDERCALLFLSTWTLTTPPRAIVRHPWWDMSDKPLSHYNKIHYSGTYTPWLAISWSEKVAPSLIKYNWVHQWSQRSWVRNPLFPIWCAVQGDPAAKTCQPSDKYWYITQYLIHSVRNGNEWMKWIFLTIKRA